MLHAITQITINKIKNDTGDNWVLVPSMLPSSSTQRPDNMDSENLIKENDEDQEQKTTLMEEFSKTETMPVTESTVSQTDSTFSSTLSSMMSTLSNFISSTTAKFNSSLITFSTSTSAPSSVVITNPTPDIIGK